jgi:GNAT superfamily N-acetyltransferase
VRSQEEAVEIIDLCPERREDYVLCMEPWSDDMRVGRELKAHWVDRMEPHGLVVKLAVDDKGATIGQIQAWPIERSWVLGSDLYMIGCTWVHGHKGKGVGDRRGSGAGRKLLQATEAEVRTRGAKGMAAWGLWLPFWMRASWYRKQGYRKADRLGMAQLVYKPFEDGVEPPRFLRPRKKPELIPGRVKVTSFSQGWCTAQNIQSERARIICERIGDPVVYERIDTSDRDTLLEWGLADALFVDSKNVSSGPPPSEEKIEKIIRKRLKRLG